jgi:hypothetical protein
VTARFEQIALSTDHPAAVIFHGILGCGSRLELRDPKTGARVAIGTYCRRYFEPYSKPRPYKHMDATLGKEAHPAQFVCCLMQGTCAPEMPLTAHTESGMPATWEYEKRECHGMMDLAWFVPAFCLSGDASPFANRFGERIDANYLVRYLLEQSQGAPNQQSCHGTHNLYALAMARKHLADELDPEAFCKLDTEWTTRVSAVLAAIGPSGVFQIQDFLDTKSTSPEWHTNTYHGVTGHLITALVAAGDPTLLRTEALHLLVSSTIEHCLSQDVWPAVERWLSEGRAAELRYGTMAHVVYGFRLYREAVSELWPHLALHRSATPAETAEGPTREVPTGPPASP